MCSGLVTIGCWLKMPITNSLCKEVLSHLPEGIDHLSPAGIRISSQPCTKNFFYLLGNIQVVFFDQIKCAFFDMQECSQQAPLGDIS